MTYKKDHDHGTSRPGGTLEEWSSVIGIIIAICGNILISFALNVQKYAHSRIARENEKRSSKSNGQRQSSATSSSSTQSQDKDERAATPDYLRSGWWWTGIVMMVIGEGGNFLAYGFAPASIVSPLGVVAIISNCIIAPVMLKETFRKRDFLGVCIAIGGAVTVALSSNPEESKLGPHAIWKAITQTAFEVYLGVTCGLIVLLLFLSWKHDDWVVVDLGLVGLFGGYTALSTKGVSSLLSTRFYKVFLYPVFYMLLSILIVTAVLQIRYINRALQRWNSTQVIPTQFVLFTLSVIIGSAILYRDFEQADGTRIAKFISGCFLTFLGVYFITSRRPDERQKDDEEESSQHEDDDRGKRTPPLLHTITEDGRSPSPTKRPQILTRPSASSAFSESDRLLPNRPPNRNHASLRSYRSLRQDDGSFRVPTSQREHRSSISILTPGPLFVGYSLQAIVSDSRRDIDGVLSRTASHTRPYTTSPRFGSVRSDTFAEIGSSHAGKRGSDPSGMVNLQGRTEQFVVRGGDAPLPAPEHFRLDEQDENIEDNDDVIQN